MPNILNEVGGNVGEILWSGLGDILVVVMFIIGIILFFVMVGLVMWWKSYNHRVTIYTPVGQTSKTFHDDVKNKIEKGAYKEIIKGIEAKKLRFDYVKTTKTHGKYTTVKGAQYFVTFKPMRRIPPVPLWLLFDDGIHMLQLSRAVIVPIQKPNLTAEIGKDVTLHLDDSAQWQTWNNMMSDRINNKYQDLDVQKKVIFYFITGIVVLTLLGGFIIWMIYKSATKGYDNASSLVDGLSNLGIGGAGPK